MGVNHNAFLGIGRRFDDEDSAIHFVANALCVDEGWIDQLFEGQSQQGLEAVCLDFYSGEDWFVGFRVGKTQEPEELSGDVMYAKNAWEEMFPGEEARVVWAVIYS